MITWAADRQRSTANPPPEPLFWITGRRWENVAYLVEDSHRQEAFPRLKREVGLRPDDILAAPHEKLVEIARAGIVPQTFAATDI